MSKEKHFVLRIREKYISIIRDSLQHSLSRTECEHLLFSYFEYCEVLDFLPSPCPYITCQHVDKTCKDCLKNKCSDLVCVYDYVKGKLNYKFPYFGLSIPQEKCSASWKSV